MAKDKNKPLPEKISRKEANRLNNFAQGLDDEITHVVDYGTMDDSDNDNSKD